MTCDTVRQLLLDLDLDEPARRRLAEALSHLEGCKQCTHAFHDFDRLAGVLRQVEHTDASPTGGWGAFERRLRAAVAEGHGRPTPRRLWSIGILSGLAASVLVGWIAFQVGQRSGSRDAAGELAGYAAATATRPTSPAHPHAMTAIPIALGPADVAQRVRAFGEVDQVFDGRTNWLMLSADASDVGLAERSAGPPANSSTTRSAATTATDPGGRKLLLVRLNLTSGTEVVSNADLVIVPGTAATVTVPTKQGNPVRYHVVTFADDPKRLAVRVEMPQKGIAGAPEATAVLGTSLELQPFHETAAGRLVTHNGTYDLTVAAAPAPQEKM